MAAGNNSVGSFRKLMINNIAFRTKADIDATQKPQYAKEAMPTSGDAMMKITKQVDALESVTLSVNNAEYEQLLAINDLITNYPLVYQTPDGVVKSATGQIIIDSRTTAEGTCTVTLVPMTDKWRTIG